MACYRLSLRLSYVISNGNELATKNPELRTKMNLIDTHCHLTFDPLASDIDTVLTRSREQGICEWITIGTDLEHSRRCVALAEQHEGMYATVGLHPHEAKDLNRDTMHEFSQLARSPKVVAIGETGLDFHYNHSSAADQIQCFRDHLDLARRLDLPVVVHTREAFDETLAILDAVEGVKRIVLHCFSGTTEQARLALARGYFFSFTGVVTFKNAHSIREAVEIIPLEKIMVETDCPYMSPEPMRRQRINEPALMIHTAERLAQLKQTSLADFALQTTETARTFFGLTPNP
jgi:TatD DNase family protein